MKIDVTTRAEPMYNYKCPNCGGEFNEPYMPQLTTNVTCSRCPFCGMVMQV